MAWPQQRATTYPAQGDELRSRARSPGLQDNLSCEGYIFYNALNINYMIFL